MDSLHKRAVIHSPIRKLMSSPLIRCLGIGILPQPLHSAEAWTLQDLRWCPCVIWHQDISKSPASCKAEPLQFGLPTDGLRAGEFGGNTLNPSSCPHTILPSSVCVWRGTHLMTVKRPVPLGTQLLWRGAAFGYARMPGPGVSPAKHCLEHHSPFTGLSLFHRASQRPCSPHVHDAHAPSHPHDANQSKGTSAQATFFHCFKVPVVDRKWWACTFWPVSTDTAPCNHTRWCTLCYDAFVSQQSLQASNTVTALSLLEPLSGDTQPQNPRSFYRDAPAQSSGNNDSLWS